VETAELALQIKALGDETRLRILQLLPVTNVCKDVYNVSELAEELGVSQPTISHHLRVLFQAGLVKCQKQCRDVYYWIHQEEMARVVGEIQQVTRQPAERVIE
jgi:ArsR family transcriptional regulator